MSMTSVVDVMADSYKIMYTGGDNLKINKIFHYKIPLNLNFNDQFMIPSKEYDAVVIIAFLGRYHVMEENIKSLVGQSLNKITKIGIILVGSTADDKVFLLNMVKKYNNIHYIMSPNNPCGAKWQSGVYYAKLFNPLSITILGSDDILSKRYLEIFHKYIRLGYDFIGKRSWHAINKNEKTLYNLKLEHILKIY
jgi:hypothetical protein